MKLAIIAGGRGTRLGLKHIPKPLVEIDNKSILEHQIRLAKKYSIKDIYILSGFLSETIVDYFGDGSAFGVNITHIIEKHPLGTAGAVKQLENNIKERFMVFYGDVFLNIDLKSFVEFDRKSHSIATIIVHPNDHPYDSDLVEINDENVVTVFHSKPHKEGAYYSNLVNAAIYILSPEIFKDIPQGKSSDFGKDIFPLVLKSEEIIRAYKTAEYIKDTGTVDRLRKVTEDFLRGKVARFSVENKRPAIFIDRDGTLVKDIELLHNHEDLELFSFSANAIKKIDDSEYLSLLITNQPIVARNLCNIDEVKHIHNKLETLLGSEHAYLNDIYFCPHHPDKGYPEENPDFKIDCSCRKPKTGMIEKAIEEYNIDIESSWFLGDTTTDIQTGINAGLKTVLVRTGRGGRDGKFQCAPDFVFDNIESAIDFILEDRDKYDLYTMKIIDDIREKKGHSPFIINVAGLARSGKSIFVKLLIQAMLKNGISTQVLSLDNWLVGVNDRTEHMTVRERYKYDEIEGDISKLLNQQKILLKIYDPYSRKIVNEEYFSLNGSMCLIIDGVPALDIDGLRNISDIKVYIDVDEEIRKDRFFSFYRWKNLQDDKIEDLYLNRLKDEVSVIQESKKNADVIVKMVTMKVHSSRVQGSRLESNED